jgi:hypothetical protein
VWRGAGRVGPPATVADGRRRCREGLAAWTGRAPELWISDALGELAREAAEAAEAGGTRSPGVGS